MLKTTKFRRRHLLSIAAAIYISGTAPVLSNDLSDDELSSLDRFYPSTTSAEQADVSGLRTSIDNGTFSVDAYNGNLQLSYVDAVIPADGNFELPIVRTYSVNPIQGGAWDESNRIFGSNWDIHFGRISPAGNIDHMPQGSVDSRWFCPRDNYRLRKFLPVFETGDGAQHVLYTPASSLNINVDAITNEFHVANCLSDGTVTITDKDGLKYHFGNQNHIKRGSSGRLPGEGTSQRVIFKDHLYVTKIEDTNGNYYDIKYSLRRNSDNTIEDFLLTIDEIKYNNSIVATFNYVRAPGAHGGRGVTDTPSIVLDTLTVGQSVVSYAYDAISPTQPATYRNNLKSVTSNVAPTSTNSMSKVWEYDYHPGNPKFGLGGTVKEVTNPYGGTTSFKYEWKYKKVVTKLHDKRLRAVTKIVRENPYGNIIGEWNLDYTRNLPSNYGHDKTTLTAYNGVKIEYTFCSNFDVCTFPSALVESNVYHKNTLRETQTYAWRRGRKITNMLDTFSRLTDYNEDDIRLLEMYKSSYRRLLLQATTKRDNAVLTQMRWDFDNFDNPKKIGQIQGNSVVQYSENGFITGDWEKTKLVTKYTYENRTNQSNWRVGLVKSVELEDYSTIRTDDASKRANDQKIVYDYYSTTGNLKTANIYGATTEYQYYGNGNLLKSTDPNNNKSEYLDYVLGIPKKEKHSFHLGGAAVTTTTREIDDVTGLVDSVTAYRDIGGSVQYKTSYGYNGLGQVESITTPKNDDSNLRIQYKTNETITTRGRRVIIQTFDHFGRMIHIQTHGDGSSRNEKYEYDAHNRITKRSYPYKTGQNPVYISYTHDSLNRILSQTEAGNRRTNYSHYGFNTTVTSPNRGITTIKHGGFGSFNSLNVVELVQQIDGSGKSVSTEIERSKRGDPLTITQAGIERKYFYDGRYRVKKEEAPETFPVVYRYDENGNIRSKRFSGYYMSTTSYTYNGRDDLVNVYYSRSGQGSGYYPAHALRKTFSYNNDGSIDTATNGRYSDYAIVQRSYDYDPNGNLTENTLVISNTSQGRKSYTVSYNYDDIDSLSSTVYPTHHLVSYNPDILGRPTRIGNYLTDIEYEANGVISYAEYGNGLIWDMGLNPQQVIGTNEVRDSQGSIWEEVIGYDNNLNVNKITSNLHPQEEYRYDHLNRLSEYKSGNGGWYRYQYDDIGNLKVHRIPENNNQVHTTTYNSNSFLPSRVTDWDGSGKSVSHNPAGVISRIGDTRYGFDKSDRLREIAYVGRNAVSYPLSLVQYRYDANDSRVLITSGERELVTFYDLNGKLIHLHDISENKRREYIYANQYLIAETNGLSTGEAREDDGTDHDNDSEDGEVDNNDSQSAVCIDSDGDGWGWDGTGSCRVGSSTSGNDSTSTSTNDTNSDATCVDSDGDGWGWNGSASCRVGGTGSSSGGSDNSSSSSSNCVDTDGDGWGWNGTSSCRVQ